jgi:hypothetical protein
MITPTEAQKKAANNALRSYAAQSGIFSCEQYQRNDFIFKAKLDCGTVFIIIGRNGAIKDNGWV